MLRERVQSYARKLGEMISSGIPNEIIITELSEEILGKDRRQSEKPKAQEDKNVVALRHVLKSYKDLKAFFFETKKEYLELGKDEEEKILTAYSGILLRIEEELLFSLKLENVTVGVVGHRYSCVDRAQMFWYRYIDQYRHPYERYVNHCSDTGHISKKVFEKIVRDCTWLYEALLTKLTSKNIKRVFILAKVTRYPKETWMTLLMRAEKILQSGEPDQFFDDIESVFEL